MQHIYYSDAYFQIMNKKIICPVFVTLPSGSDLLYLTSLQYANCSKSNGWGFTQDIKYRADMSVTHNAVLILISFLLSTFTEHTITLFYLFHDVIQEY